MGLLQVSFDGLEVVCGFDEYIFGFAAGGSGSPDLVGIAVYLFRVR